MDDNNLIKALKKQIERVNLLLKNPKIDSRKSWKATNITLLDSLFGKNNEYSREFQEMSYGFIFSELWIPMGTDFQYYNNYITTWKTILLSAVDICESAGEAVITWNKSKSSTKKSQTINVNNNNIINQTQTTNINIDNILKNELRWKDYEELKKILQGRNEKTKWEKLLKFLRDLWLEALTKIIKEILLWN